jgi:hypothetical protein
MTLLENPGALPRAFLPARVLVERDPERRLAAIAAATDFSRTAWLDAPVAGITAAEEAGRGASGRVAVRESGGDLELVVESDAAVLVATSLPAWPGWSARGSRGERLPLATVNHAFVGIGVPAGRHEMRLRYRPESAVWGAAAGALGAALLLMVASRGRRREEAF